MSEKEKSYLTLESIESEATAREQAVLDRLSELIKEDWPESGKSFSLDGAFLYVRHYFQSEGTPIEVKFFQGTRILCIISFKNKGLVVPLDRSSLGVHKAFDLFENSYERMSISGRHTRLDFNKKHLKSFPEVERKIDEKTGDKKWVITKKGLLETNPNYKSREEINEKRRRAKENLKNLVDSIIDTILEERVGYLVKNPQDLERIFLGAPGPVEVDVEKDNDPDEPELNKNEELKMIIGGIIKTMSVERAEELLGDIAGLQKLILGEESEIIK